VAAAPVVVVEGAFDVVVGFVVVVVAAVVVPGLIPRFIN